METVSFGGLEDARLTLSFGMSGASPLRTFMGDEFTPDRITLSYEQECVGEDSWSLTEVSVSGPEPGPWPGRHSVGCAWRDAGAKLPAQAWLFAAGVDPSRELGYADE